MALISTSNCYETSLCLKSIDDFQMKIGYRCFYLDKLTSQIWKNISKEIPLENVNVNVLKSIKFSGIYHSTHMEHLISIFLSIKGNSTAAQNHFINAIESSDYSIPDIIANYVIVLENTTEKINILLKGLEYSPQSPVLNILLSTNIESSIQFENIENTSSTTTNTTTTIDLSCQSTYITPSNILSIYENKPLQVHIGCIKWDECARENWIVVDALNSIMTHFQLQVEDLHVFSNGSVSVLYSSHVLEHLAYFGNDCELCKTLREWRRILKLDGIIMISVPDLEILAELLTDTNLSNQSHYEVMQMMFGGQLNEYDYHKTGLYFEFLEELLEENGFCNVQKVHHFGYFIDSSDLIFEAASQRNAIRHQN
eukprot:gene9849-20486_t